MDQSHASSTARTYKRLLQPDLKLMLIENDVVGLQQFCEVLNPAIVAEVLFGLDPASAWRVLSSSDIKHQADIFEFLEPTQQIELVANIDRQHLSKLIEAMSPDDRVDLMENLDEVQIEALLPLIAQAERDEIRKMLSYPEDSAGSIMTTEYASLPDGIPVGEALNLLRQQAPNRETIYYVFVVDAGRRILGVISLRELILARPSALIADIMTRDFISVHVRDDQEEAARLIARFDLIALPVLDADERLVGIITHDDVLDVIQEEANEDAYLQAAIDPLEHSYFSTPLLTIAFKRGVWLLFLSIMALVTATAMRSFGDRAKSNEWLEWFLPLVLASGGNTGSQSATLVIRAMAVITMNRRDKIQLATRELLTGLILGLTLGVFNWLALQGLFGRDPIQSGVVSLTIALVVTMGTVVGSLLPILFDRLGMDPAIMSNPLIASLSDFMGVVIYFSVAIWLLA
ncbi:magnesium transporter [Schlesneria paludicola]|uniref:magnesium transporter n=1 Tax=Schlesneria paludicola TaxID=360056 RepID=UPI00029B44D9|nr:magnesium transporter [Schlesneria paludicola]